MNVELDEEPKVGRETQDGGVVSGADGHLCSARERSVVSAPSLPPKELTVIRTKAGERNEFDVLTF